MLLGVSLLSALVVGVIGYRSGTASLRDSVEERLIEVRQSKTRELDAYFDNLQNGLVIDTRGTTAVDAVRGFSAGFDELNAQPTNPARAAAVKKYYDTNFLPAYEKATGTQIESDAFLPTSAAQQYLQADYTVKGEDFDAKLAIDDGGDGSAWSKVHAKYHDYFRELTVRFGYEDVFLLDTVGNVVYSAYKGVDFGTNVETGPYRGGAFQRVYDGALHSNSADYFGLSDFERYQPSLGVPTGFAGSPISAGGQVKGVLMVQLPLERINSLMTGDQQWEANGLGRTGETYLVGSDKLMRTNSRLLLQNPEQYEKDAIDAGTAPALAQRAVQVKGSVLIQPVDTDAVDRGLRGQSGITTGPGYLGRDALTAYAPVDVDGLQWVIIAKVESAEAFAPVTTFARNLGVSTALLILLVSLAALLLARVFTRPIQRLVTAVQKIAGGDLETQVPVTTRDEFGDLGHSFNDMSKSLRTKAELLNEEQAENERLLLSMMPADVARRYREGEETIAQEHQNVSVIFADIAGTEDLAKGRTSHEALALTNALVRGFDEAAERIGMEKVRTLRTGYLASCGLVTPRLDNARRTLEFAREMEQVLQRFNAQHGFRLALRAGIDTGPVTSGLVGRSSIVYDMWGDAVNLAYQVRNTSGRPGIYVTQSVYDRLRNEFTFDVAAEGDSASGNRTTWALQTEVAHA